MKTDEILQRLKSGNSRFVQDKREGLLQDQARRNDLTSGQSPYAIILSCADSRVVPEMAFDTGLGELFVVRVAGNVANVESVASIEYAVANCLSGLIVVLGHESCGAVTAAVAGGDNGRNINQLLAHISPVVKANKTEEISTVIKANVDHVVNELQTNSEIISNAIKAGEVKVVPAYYNLGSGQVDFL